MHWTGWIVVLLLSINCGWMAFDGGRALIVGDYITPSSGDHAGQLGPWANLVETTGLEPRSTLVKLIFVIYGVAGLLAVLSFALQLPWGWWSVVIVAVLGLWYLPFGTVLGIVALILLWLLSLCAF